MGISNLSLDDPVQIEIIKHMATTERLLSLAASTVSGTERESNVYLLPDLGIPRGIQRIHGGFFTGAIYCWDTSVPFVPVDATVNCCGVSAFRLTDRIGTRDEFLCKIRSAIRRIGRTSYVWNFNVGNHFISYGEANGMKEMPDGPHVILHSSAAEFKHQYNGLYPSDNNWFRSKIKVVDNGAGRYLRYIEGRTAEIFIGTARMLEAYNKIRHKIIAGLIFGEDSIEEEVVNTQHYGMPTGNCVSIGCQWMWKPSVYLLLTNARSKLYFVRALSGGRNTVVAGGREFTVVPHGLGNTLLHTESLQYDRNGLIIGKRKYARADRLTFGGDIAVRGSDLSDDGIETLVGHYLAKCPGTIVGSIEQLYNYNRDTVLT